MVKSSRSDKMDQHVITMSAVYVTCQSSSFQCLCRLLMKAGHWFSSLISSELIYIHKEQLYWSHYTQSACWKYIWLVITYIRNTIHCEFRNISVIQLAYLCFIESLYGDMWRYVNLQYGSNLITSVTVFAGSSVNSSAVGIVVGFGILGILFTIAIIQFCCKYKCKKFKKCCKKKGEWSLNVSN